MRTDVQLIRAALVDPEAFAELYRRHVGAVHAYLRHRAPAAVASELTAETFARAAIALRRFRDEADGSALPWLYGIARNLLRSYSERAHIETKARARLGMPLHSYDLDTEAIDRRIDSGRLTPALASALDALPVTQRDALELRVVNGLSYNEVASSLGCSEVAARVRVTRAISSLSRQLKGTLA